ncbi:unnamed protein product [Closterium sp. Naga37s-1]|nr:unnamed protein product [Closterium sp. Naga37s-1]
MAAGNAVSVSPSVAVAAEGVGERPAQAAARDLGSASPSEAVAAVQTAAGIASGGAGPLSHTAPAADGVGDIPAAAAAAAFGVTGNAGGAGGAEPAMSRRLGVASESESMAIDLVSVMPTRNDAHPLLTAGSARCNPSSLSLTTLSDLDTAALALHPTPFALLAPATPSSPCRLFSFSTSFTFRISSPNAAGLGGEGLAFAMLPSPTLGLPGPSLGYGRLLLPPGSTTGADNASDVSSQVHVISVMCHLRYVSSQQHRSLAVEFDTSSSPEFFDRPDHHVGVNLHGSMLSLASAPMHPLGIPSLNAGQTLLATIQYNASSSHLTWLGGNDPEAAAPPPAAVCGIHSGHRQGGRAGSGARAAEDPLPFWAADSFSFPYIMPATPLLTHGSTRKRFFAADLSISADVASSTHTGQSDEPALGALFFPRRLPLLMSLNPPHSPRTTPYGPLMSPTCLIPMFSSFPVPHTLVLLFPRASHPCSPLSPCLTPLFSSFLVPHTLVLLFPCASHPCSHLSPCLTPLFSSFPVPHTLVLLFPRASHPCSPLSPCLTPLFSSFPVPHTLVLLFPRASHPCSPRMVICINDRHAYKGDATVKVLHTYLSLTPLFSSPSVPHTLALLSLRASYPRSPLSRSFISSLSSLPMPRTCALLTLRLPRSLHPPSSDTDPCKGSPVLPYGTCVCTEAPAPWDPSIPVPHTLSLLTSPSISLTPFISPPTDTYPCKGSPVLPCGTGVCTKARAPWDPSILVPSCKCPFKLPSFEPTHLAGLPSCFPETFICCQLSTYSAPRILFALPPQPNLPCPLTRLLHVSTARQHPMCPEGVYQCCAGMVPTPVLLSLPPESPLTRLLHMSPALQQPMCPGETFTCRHLASNPCAPGVCIDEMDGTYSCLCPLPFISFYFFSKDTARDVSKR